MRFRSSCCDAAMRVPSFALSQAQLAFVVALVQVTDAGFDERSLQRLPMAVVGSDLRSVHGCRELGVRTQKSGDLLCAHLIHAQGVCFERGVGSFELGSTCSHVRLCCAAQTVAAKNSNAATPLANGKAHNRFGFMVPISFGEFSRLTLGEIREVRQHEDGKRTSNEGRVQNPSGSPVAAICFREKGRKEGRASDLAHRFGSGMPAKRAGGGGRQQESRTKARRLSQ